MQTKWRLHPNWWPDREAPLIWNARISIWPLQIRNRALQISGRGLQIWIRGSRAPASVTVTPAGLRFSFFITRREFGIPASGATLPLKRGRVTALVGMGRYYWPWLGRERPAPVAIHRPAAVDGMATRMRKSGFPQPTGGIFAMNPENTALPRLLRGTCGVSNAAS